MKQCQKEYCPACGAEAKLEAYNSAEKMCAVFIVHCDCPDLYREERRFGDVYPKDPHTAWIDSRLALMAKVRNAKEDAGRQAIEQEFGEGIVEDMKALMSVRMKG